jgi:type II protein arginine methyltransferase
MLDTFERALEGVETYALGMVGLAETAAAKGRKVRAFELCQKALAAAGGDPEVQVRARRVLHSLTPRYHVRMMNDEARNLAWDAALARAVGPATKALEIGTGAGMLALMAARAGAAKITTCERDPLLAHLAERIVARNGFADRVDVIAKRSTDLVLGEDLAEAADLLFCDIFGDHLLDFDPLRTLADARGRLTTPDAKVIPAAGAIMLGLADWRRYPIVGHIDHAAGFDVTDVSDFVPASLQLPVDSLDVSLRSHAVEAIRFDFSALTHPSEGRREVWLTAHEAGVVNGIAQWIRLELDEETTLENRPEPGAASFSTPRFWPFAEPRTLRAGETLRACLAYAGRSLTLWPL